MDQPGKVANPTRGQLNRENDGHVRYRQYRKKSTEYRVRPIPKDKNIQVQNTKNRHTKNWSMILVT